MICGTTEDSVDKVVENVKTKESNKENNPVYKTVVGYIPIGVGGGPMSKGIYYDEKIGNYSNKKD